MPVTDEGLTSYEAKKLLEKFGPNILPEKKPVSGLTIFVSQLKSPLVYVLVFAGLVTLFLGHYTDSSVILFAIIINTFLGFFQEKRANSALDAIKKLIEPKAIVIRDGKDKTINGHEVVPGDICVLNSGDKVPADGKIVFANRLFISEAILTGESIPVSKENGNEAYMGTVITSGRGKLLVKLTGAETEVGKIAKDIQEPSEETPIKKQLGKFASQLTVLVVILTLIVFIVGILIGKDPFEIFTTSVALAVSAIPEGLLVGLTVVLAIGMQRILKRKGLVRNLVSAETLGGVTTICVDKTGTLTEGKMEVYSVSGNKVEVAKQSLIANDMDDPIVLALWDWGNKNIDWKEVGHENIDEFVKHHSRIDSIPFSAKHRYFAGLNKHDSKNNYLYVNGAPEFLLEWSYLSRAKKNEIRKEIEKYSAQGMRLLALARKKVPLSKNKIFEKDVNKELEWVGLVAFSDPVRVGVKEALQKTIKAGIRVVVITGDYAQTASSVLKQLGISVNPKNVILGEELFQFSESEISEKVLSDKKNTVVLFARTTPEQKLKIVDSLKSSGEVVAMTGDGVNDALALKKADIGIVVGSATEVAKESADLVLLDSSFTTIVGAIEEGRGIFANLRKIILYLMTDSFSEIIAVLGSMIFLLPLPVTAVQILWINLVSDGFPHLALTVDPKDKNIMSKGPRNPKEPLISNWMKELIALVSLFSGIFALIVFILIFKTTGNLKMAQSVTFATLGVNSLIYVFSIRTLTESFLSLNPFGNVWLNVAVIAGFLLQAIPFLTPTTRNFLGVEKLGFFEWVVVILVGMITFILIEAFKKLFRFSHK